MLSFFFLSSSFRCMSPLFLSSLVIVVIDILFRLCGIWIPDAVADVTAVATVSLAER